MAINATLRFTLAELTRTIIDLEEVRDDLTADIAKLQDRIDQIRAAIRAPTHLCDECGGMGEVQEALGQANSEGGEDWRTVPCPTCLMDVRREVDA